MGWLGSVNRCRPVKVRVAELRPDAGATVPGIVRVADRGPKPGVIKLLPPVKVTVEPIDVRVAAEEVSQDPAMETVVVPRLRTARPLEVRLPSKMVVELVSVNAPDQVMLEANVVLMPGLTTTSCRVCGTSMEPPEMLSTTVEA